VLVAAAAIVVVNAAWAPTLHAQSSVLARPGWATGGTPTDPASQIAADEKYARADCAANTLLLFRVRGSGEQAGSDKLGAWAFAAGQAAIKKGWRVRDMQGDYPAPNLPTLTVNIAHDAAALKRYRDVATNSWPSMKTTLIAAYNRCPQRKMLIAAYSQGALVMRYVIRSLPSNVRAQVAQVDLLGDPTADTKVDTNLQHPTYLGGRLTDGIDTKAARTTHVGLFQQTPYPADIAPRTYQYCLPNDWVCDFNPISILRAGRKAHEHYDWAGIGRQASTLLRGWSQPTTGRGQAVPANLRPRLLALASKCATTVLQPGNISTDGNCDFPPGYFATDPNLRPLRDVVSLCTAFAPTSAGRLQAVELDHVATVAREHYASLGCYWSSEGHPDLQCDYGCEAASAKSGVWLNLQVPYPGNSIDARPYCAQQPWCTWVFTWGQAAGGADGGSRSDSWGTHQSNGILTFERRGSRQGVLAHRSSDQLLLRAATQALSLRMPTQCSVPCG